MKVLLTTDAIGGVWSFSLSLARALRRCRGVEVHIATMGRRLTANQRLEIADFPFYESEFPLEWMPDAWPGVDAAGRWLGTLEGEIKPEVVHHNTVALGRSSFQTPVVVTVHSCVLSWWEAVKGGTAPPEWDQYRERVACSLRAADEIVAPTYQMLQAARRLYGLGEYGTVVPNFVEPFAAKCPKEPFVFAAGRTWDEGKNLVALQRIAPELSWPVHIAGEGSALGHLDRREIAGWYARAAIYAWPAKYEPFGLSVLEAGQHGCALVLGDIASLRENWDGAAHFVRSDKDLRDAIQRLIADPALRDDLAERARERAGRFSERETVKGYSAAYAKVLSGVLCAS